MGHVDSDEGLKADPVKVEAVLAMPEPTDVEGVQRMNGFVNYLSKFLPNLSTLMEPIRRLTRKSVEWDWGPEQAAAFRTVKKLVAAAPVLRYYDPKKELSVQCDASKSGLGAVLLQEGQPIAYASRSMSGAEQRYAQIEKEMLAIVFAMEKFHQYTYGRRVCVQSDHKPLESIMKKSLDKAPKRLQAMMLRLQKYTLDISYVPGKTIVLADTLSRAYIDGDSSNDHEEFAHVHVTKYLPITDRRLLLLKEATASDEVLRCLRELVTDGWPSDKSMVPPAAMPFFHFRDEITAHDGLLMRGNRVIVPHSMRMDMKEKIHSSHVGIEACLRRARECLFWPNMSVEIKDYVSQFEVCAKFSENQQKETIMCHDLPDRPWSKVGVDLFELEGSNYVVVVDYNSNFWEINKLDDTSSQTVVRKLKAHFARYGIPDTLVSDNGPQFASKEFANFADKWDFDHTPSSPGHSQSNGRAEAAVKAAKKMLKKALDAKSDPYLALLDIRNTPSQDSGYSPAQKLMGRRTRTLLPTTETLLKPDGIPGKMLLGLAKTTQQRQAKYYNQHARDLPLLEEGDRVRLQPFQRNRPWQSGTVVKRLDERSYEVETESGSVLRRNRVYLRKSADTKVPTSVPQDTPPEVIPQPCPPMLNEGPSTPAKQPAMERADISQKPTPPQISVSPTKKSRSGRIIRTPERYRD